MTTNNEPAQPAGQERATIVLDAEELAAAAAEQAGETLEELAAPVTAPPLTAAEAAESEAAESGAATDVPGAAAPETAPETAPEAEQVAATTPRLPAVAPAPLPSHMLPAGTADDPGATTQLPIPEAGAPATESELAPTPAPQAVRAAASEPAAIEGIADEVDPDWAVADQPTVAFTPPAPPRQTQRPAFLETGEQEVWPPRPTPTGTPPIGIERPAAQFTPPPRPAFPASGPSAETGAPPTSYATNRPRTLGQVQPSPIPRPTSRPITNTNRLASPTGRLALGSTSSAYSDPRMRRLVELRLQRDAHSAGHQGPGENAPVAQMLRQWWADLLPGLAQALDHMHEARESGVYPIPAHEPTAVGRLGDAFGRVTRAARDLGERAQAAAAPTLNKLHERAEQAAQALVERIEGPPVRQQAPLLGPGRVAVFFQQGVTVVQAQRLLVTNRARPLRLIPRRHGFLAFVQPGQEPVVGEQLRQHPYVRDVVYLEYDANGEPLPPR